ncbi:MFS transporter [Pusillimonas noertemannii]|uniref:AAHS family 4-hydroxybenzoate transporter-like MFS transporter n=1 Tax=Pusillimonas noertemannii TaxID=305977 RepID=A0A2U1CHN5_9BURK|nr:aromatic acid/H+ symport family MFS transporter [Pusillimonas noertemannii]NYT70284.1 aromatic acid/H+ symport family MFS transporter [Pusillimonas noertemannii]PVY60426.1 AAHS family 4-hydroxybenzoate transporter-like MFS transporter [Pusillimonas noertemannii]TFL08077.1 MFS transporter [Pusillimonas noertemannii]
MSQSTHIDVQDFLDKQKLSGLQILTLFLCFFIVAVDGFDTAAIGFIAPAIRAEWGLDAAHLAPVFGAGLFGLMAGSLIFGPLADRYGRKRILMLSVFFFGLMTLLSAWSTSVEMLIALRFLTGLGLGGAMPNAITMSSEYSPQRHRSVLVTTMFCGFTLGSAMGGIAAAHIVESFGWHWVLVMGGVLPIVLVPVLALIQPESPRYLALKGGADEQVRRLMQRIAPNEDLAGATFTVREKRAPGFPVKHLFAPELRFGTLSLWATVFMTLLVIYLLSSWLPTVINNTGMSLKNASLVTAMFQVGGTAGAIILGRLMDRYSPQRVLGITYLIGAAFTFMIGSTTGSTAMLVLAVFGAGFCVSGGQVGTNALAAAFYPTGSRATGVSWSLGIGRIGSILGSLAGGWMLVLGWSISTIFLAVSIPSLIAALCMAAMARKRKQAAPGLEQAIGVSS